MNKGVKTIGVIVSLLLLSILLFAILLSAVYPLPFQLERFRFFSITNVYVQQYVFWLAVAFAILTIILLLVLIFYPKTIGSFLLKREDGELVLDKKAIEGLVLSHLQQEEFIHAPKVNVKATKNKIAVNVKGELKRTSALIGKTGTVMKEIEQEIKHVLGDQENVKVAIKYTGYEQPNKKTSDQSRVE
ncbi:MULTISPECIES: alkaline shock response membrane anchor protein AmaP [unclassified Enterococcus]|uniref:alkaline shock response membrane anchor protein AmaP n=1 Tax=unclassified Enterococcus TaxID=2608891 RepID=UPI0013EA453D|nr:MULTISPECIES: alkaline shock response membrane anchor protein AmaP [unclassified Enterococcus]